MGVDGHPNLFIGNITCPSPRMLPLDVTMLVRLALGALLLAGGGCAGGNRHAVEKAVGSVTAPRSSSSSRKTPDPSFINLKWGPLQLAPGATSTAELDLVNRGEQPTGPFRVGVFATAGSSVVTANKKLLGSVDIDSLASQPQHVIVTITAPATPGSYAVGIEIDDLRQLRGDDRGNNHSGPAQLFVK